MEYFRDEKNRIQADFSYRLGKIIKQYEKFLPELQEEEKFESTLYVCVLQNLLTYCSELLSDMEDDGRLKAVFNSPMSDSEIFNLSKIIVSYGTNRSNIKVGKLITHLRNSISHPTQFELNGNSNSTGYTTIENESKTIEKYLFIHSPKARNKDELKEVRDYEIAKIEMDVKSLRNFVIDLSNLLAQPIREHWDGKEIIDIIK